MATAPDEHDPFPATTLHVQGACAGQADSVDWIVRRFTPLMLAQARYRLGNRMAQICDPEDVVNDVWLTLLPRLQALQPRGGRYTPMLVAFLSTATVNRVNNLVMKHLRGRPRPTDIDLSALPVQTQGVVSRAVRAEEKDVVLTAIEALDDIDREAIILGAIEQRPRVEMAAALGVSEGAARVRLHRAIQRLRAQLPGSVFDELDPGDPPSDSET